MTQPQAEPRRILVIHVTRIGDTVMVTPALCALAAAWPAAKITFLGHPRRAEVIEHLPAIATVGTITKRSAPLRGWLGPQSGSGRWDLGLVYGSDAELVRYALRVCSRVVAFRQGEERIDRRLFRAVERPAHNSMHGVDQLLLLPQALGIESASRALEYRVMPDEAEAAARRLAADGVARGAHPLIGLVVESFPTKPYRDWSAGNFAALGQRIVQRYPSAHFLLFGGKLPLAKLEPLAVAVGPRLTVYAGRLSLRETAALLARVDLYVGVDTGPTHLAGALRVPMVALYHCLHPARLLAPPEHPRLTALDHPAVETPACSERSDLAAITVESVWGAAEKRLAAGRRAPA